jgi:hypothetical protein
VFGHHVELQGGRVPSLVHDFNCARIANLTRRNRQRSALKEETAKVVNELNALINGPIRKVNDALASQPHIVTGALLK